MNQVMTHFAVFVADRALELTLGFITLMVLAAFILLIVLIRRKPGKCNRRLQDDFCGPGKQAGTGGEGD